MGTDVHLRVCAFTPLHPARIPTIATCVPRAGFAWVTKKLKEEQVLSIPLCTTNRINMPQVAEEVLAGGSAVRASRRPFVMLCCCWFDSIDRLSHH